MSSSSARFVLTGPVSGSSRGRIMGSLPSCPPPCGNAPIVCPDLPCVPPQGAVMPVLYNPSRFTNLHTLDIGTPSVYTLNLITTAVIPAGIVLRFQMWDGINLLYATADALGSGGIAQWDLVVSKTIPVGTVVVVVVTATTTGLVSFTGSETYASGGPGVNGALLSANNSCLCWAFAPTAQGAWVPATGQPMFAIGFSWSAETQGTACGSSDPAPLVGPTTTAPNFPDQWCLTSALTWTFLYEVVFQRNYTVSTTSGSSIVLQECFDVDAIKVAYGALPVFSTGEWSNLRDVLSQPWTVVLPTSVTPSRWQAYDGTGFTDSPDVGPFVVAAEPGQLAVVFFQPRHQDLGAATISPPEVGDYTVPGRLGLLVTSPLAANSSVSFTLQPYNSYLGGFGPRRPTTTGSGCVTGAAFVVTSPDFIWNVGSFIVPAGTVVFIDNIGSGVNDPRIVDAHNTTANRIGSITIPAGSPTTLGERSVDSIMIVSDWTQGGTGTIRPILASRFVTAVLSTDYCGDFPPLSPMLTMPRTRLYGGAAYGLGKVFNNPQLPGTVQAALINSAQLTPLTYAECQLVTPADMPVFTGMGNFYW